MLVSGRKGGFDVFGDQVSDTSIGDFCTDAIRGEEGRTFHPQKKVAAVFLKSLSSGPPWSPGPQSMTGLQFQKVRFP